MTPSQALEELEQQIPPGTALTHALTKFVQFYVNTDIDGCPKTDDGDMLLFEWGGPYPWDQSVSLSLTRQFSFNDEHGEYDHMQQLHMHCRYDPAQVSLVSSNEWLDGMDADTMLDRVLNAPCTKLVEHLRMQALDFDLYAV